MTWQIREHKPSGILSEYLDCYWSENYVHGKGQKQLRVFPDNTIELIFSEEPIIRNGLRYYSHISGLKTKSQLVSLKQSPLIAVRFKPYGLFPFIKGKPEELLNQNLAAEAVFGKEILELEEQLFLCIDFETRVKVLEQFFLKKLIKQDISSDFSPEIHRFIESKNGLVQIQDLLDKTGLSHKSLERKFKKNFGLSPKRYLRLQRVFQALKGLQSDPNRPLTGIAYDYGFYDQAHFNHEVQNFTGLNPARFRIELSELQATLFLPAV